MRCHTRDLGRTSRVNASLDNLHFIVQGGGEETEGVQVEGRAEEKQALRDGGVDRAHTYN